jgi:hypothetical protein
MAVDEVAMAVDAIADHMSGTGHAYAVIAAAVTVEWPADVSVGSMLSKK